jgi:4-amino-4-deoxy-L-arabinose transferase-like glycosyltransferase
MMEESDNPAVDDPRPAAHLTRWRGPLTALLLGGLLLVLAGQHIFAVMPPADHRLLYLVIGTGLLAFATGSYLLAGRRLPDWFARLVRRAARWLDVSAGQLVLLGLAPWFALLAALAAGENLMALDLPVSLLAWLAAVLAVLAGGYRRTPAAACQQPITRAELLGLAAIFLAAFLLRSVAIGTLPTTLSGDEGSAGLMAVRFRSGQANNLFTVGWFSFPSLYFAIQSLGIFLLDQTIAGLRITSALAGALTVAAVYWLARDLFDRTVAIVAAVFLAAFHYHIHFSRIGLNNIWDGLFAVLVLGSLWSGWKSGQRTGFLLLGLVLGLGQYFYVSMRVFPLVLLVWLVLVFLVDRPAVKRHVADLLLSAYVALVVSLPLIFFFARHPNEFNAPIQRVTIFDGWLAATMEQQGRSAVAVIGDQMLKTTLGFTHLPLRHWYDPGVPMLLGGAAALFILGLLWSLTNLNRRYLLLLLPLLAMIVLGGLSQDAPASQRYVLVAPFVAILVAVPIVQVSEWLTRFWPRYRPLILAAVVALVAWLALNDVRYYFFEVYDNYVLGDYNTEVATVIAGYLDEQDPAPAVFFFGFPRMGYYSLSTIPYLVPQVEAQDVLEPLAAVPAWDLTGPTFFIFLPERAEELPLVRAAYPEGNYRQIRNERGDLLFVSYEWRPGQR